MIESIYIFLAAIAFVVFILHYFERGHILGMLSVILWLLVLVQSIYIQVPGDTFYMETAFLALPIAFIFTDIAIMLSEYFYFREEDRFMP